MSETQQKLAASIFPRLDVRRYRTSRTYRDEIDSLVTQLGVGGFVLFDGDVDDVFRATTLLHQKGEGRLIFAADCEDGVTMRFPGGTEFPSMMALGTANDLPATYSVARSIAREMRAIGLTWNFAPVADVNSNPGNPIINIRSFGSQPRLVADHVHAYIRGMQDGGVIATAKHFPGHGDTSADSHIEIPVIMTERKGLDSVELPPFREAVRRGVMSVMVSHIAVPALDPSNAPSSLSEPIVQGLLRDELGYDGLIVTDALDMHAISRSYSSEDAASGAYMAGCDVLCIPEVARCALNGLTRMADTKMVGKRRINRTFERIRAAREWVQSFADVPPSLSVAMKGHDVIALEAARRSIVVNGRLRKLNPPVLVVAVADAHAGNKPSEWINLFSDWYQGEAEGVVVTPEISDEDAAGLSSAIDSAGTVIVPLFVRPRGFAGTVDLAPVQENLVRRAIARRSVIMTFGNPYLLRDTEPNLRISCYSASSATLVASIEALARGVK